MRSRSNSARLATTLFTSSASGPRAPPAPCKITSSTLACLSQSLSRTQSDILRASRSRLVTTTTSTRLCTHHESSRRSAGRSRLPPLTPRSSKCSSRATQPSYCMARTAPCFASRHCRPALACHWQACSVAPRSARAARRTRSGPAHRARPTGGCRWRSGGRGGRRRRSSWAPPRGVPASMAVSGCSTFDSWRLLARLLVGSPVTELGRR